MVLKGSTDLNRIWKGNGPERGSYEDVVKTYLYG